jgi:hypothetical protein
MQTFLIEWTETLNRRVYVEAPSAFALADILGDTINDADLIELNPSPGAYDSVEDVSAFAVTPHRAEGDVRPSDVLEQITWAALKARSDANARPPMPAQLPAGGLRAALGRIEAMIDSTADNPDAPGIAEVNAGELIELHAIVTDALDRMIQRGMDA